MLELEIGMQEKPTSPTTTQDKVLEGTVLPEILVSVEPDKVEKLFTLENALDPLIAIIAAKAKEAKPDASTEKGRKEIASIAYKVARTKTYLDDLGKDLVSKLKALPKKIDDNRAAMRTKLDALKEEVRRPLADWEAEQLRIELEKQARAEAEALEKEILFCHEIGLLLNVEHDRKQAEAKRQAEQAQKDLEERLAREAQAEAEARIQVELEAARQREAEARIAQEKAEQERAEAEARAERERQEAAEREEQARIEAIQAEKRRQEEQARQERETQAKREADISHRRAINGAALTDLVALGVTEEVAKIVITGIAQGKVRNVAIHY